MSSNGRINSYLEKNDGTESGNTILKPEDKPEFQSAITQCNTKDNNLTNSIGLRCDESRMYND